MGFDGKYRNNQIYAVYTIHQKIKNTIEVSYWDKIHRLHFFKQNETFYKITINSKEVGAL